MSDSQSIFWQIPSASGHFKALKHSGILSKTAAQTARCKTDSLLFMSVIPGLRKPKTNKKPGRSKEARRKAKASGWQHNTSLHGNFKARSRRKVHSRVSSKAKHSYLLLKLTKCATSLCFFVATCYSATICYWLAQSMLLFRCPALSPSLSHLSQIQSTAR